MLALRGLCVLSLLVLVLCDGKSDAILKDAFNCFSLQFYKKLVSGPDSMVSSPFSLDMVLSMIRSGAEGQTAQQLDQALGYSGQLNPSLMQGSIQRSLEQMTSSPGSDLDIANSVWIDKNFQVRDSFKDVVTTSFKSKIENVDFANNASGATDQINKWTSESTHNMISKLFDDTLDQNTVMVLANAMFYNGTWKSEFDPENTKKEQFFNGGSQNSAVDVQMMNQMSSFRYKKDADAEYLELPYQGEHVSMLIILPKEGTRLEDFEISRTCDTLKSSFESLEQKEVDVTIPKFETNSKYDLKPPMQEMGIVDAFEDNADFSGISGQATKVSKAIQKCVIKVNEAGTEAAVVTGLSIVPLSIRQPDVTFRADRPFMYMLKHKQTDMILFVGRVNQL